MVDPKVKHIDKNKHVHVQTHVQNIFVIVKLLCGTQGRRERKRECYSINNIINYNIYVGRRYKDMY
jgi:hypothetical protein